MPQLDNASESLRFAMIPPLQRTPDGDFWVMKKRP